MTCIVALEHGGEVWMGGDAAAVSSGGTLTLRMDEKVFRNGPFVIGFTDSFRMGQILRYRFNPPPQQEALSDVEYMTTVFLDSVREALAGNGWMRVEHYREEGGNFLVGYRGTIYEVDSDFQVGTMAYPFAALGCGIEIALGALYVTDGEEPAERLGMALQAAEQFSTGVRGPFTIIRSA